MGFGNKKVIKEKSLVLVDCDGVLADFCGTIISAVNNKITYQQVRQLGDWDIVKLFNQEEIKRYNAILSEDSFWRYLPVFPASIEGIEKLRSKDCEVVFVTAPWNGCKTWADARKSWLKYYFSTKDDEVIITSRKDLVFGNVFIDDRVSMVEKWKERWKHYDSSLAILCETNTNFKSDLYPRIQTRDGRWRLTEKNEIGEIEDGNL